MKKIFTSALGLAAVMSAATAFAENSTVTSKSEWTSIAGAERSVDAVDTIFLKPADGKLVNAGNWTQPAAAMRGKLVVVGVNNDANEMPELRIRWNFSHNEEADHYSLEVYNCKLSYDGGAVATSGQLFYDNKQGAYLDELNVHHCEITDIPRTFYRSVPTDADADGNIVYGRIGVFSVTDCDAHYMNIAEGNTWAFIVMGTPFDELTIKNNTFYDMPYQKQFMSMSYINKDFVESADGIVTVENNDFFMATNQTYPFFQFDNNIGMMSEYHFNNNVFMRPTWEGDYINVRPTQDAKDEDGNVIGTEPRQQQIARISYGQVEAKNNIIDETYRESSADGWTKNVYLDEDGEGAWLMDDTEPGILPEVAGFTWADMPFAAEGNFVREKAFGNPNQVGAIPVKTTVNVSAEGMKAASVIISPEKAAYFVGDEVTLTVNTHNSKYRQFGNFLHWEDGSTENPRKVVLTEENNFVATVEENIKGVISAFTFPTIAGNNNSTEESDIYATEAYKAVLYTTAYDTTGYATGEIQSPFALHTTLEDAYVFQARQGKFGEDPLEDQMGIVSRRTPGVVITLGQQDPVAVIVEFGTKEATGLSFSCYVGSDNYAYKTQKAYWSLDGTTWTEFASVDLTTRAATFSAGEGQLFGWDELVGTLPADVENQEKVYVKVVGDITGEKLWNTANTFAEGSDMFEYVGNILITASGSNGIESLRGDKTQGEAVIYDLQGRRVLNVVPGQLYISAGKRFIQK